MIFWEDWCQFQKRAALRHIIFCERLPSGIAGWRGGWIAHIGSEGTRSALLPAGPVPERWNVKLVFIETPDGQRLAGRARSASYIFLDLFHLTRAEILYLVNNKLLYGFRKNQNPHYVKEGDHLQEIAKWIGI